MAFFRMLDAPVGYKARDSGSEGGEGYDGDRILGNEPKKYYADRSDDLATANTSHRRQGLEEHKGKDATNFDRVHWECRLVLALLVDADICPVFTRAVGVDGALFGSIN